MMCVYRWIAGEITLKERKALDKYREDCQINQKSHLKALEELGWTEDDYLQGVKRLVGIFV
jgi:hypothetical protein